MTATRPPAPTAAQPVGYVARDSSTAHMRVNLPEGTPLYNTPVPEQAQPAGVTEDARDPLIDLILSGLTYEELHAKAVYLMGLNANQARTIDALTDDAARYQHLVAACNIDHDPSEPWQLVIWEPATGEDWKAKLDAAIDAARA